MSETALADDAYAGIRTANEAEARAFTLYALPDGFLDDPYPMYHALRRFDPVHRLPDGSYFLSRHADCLAVYRDPKRFCSDKTREFGPKYGESSPLYLHHTTSLVFNDPPRHTRVRKLLAPAFTPRALRRLEPVFEQMVEDLLDRGAAQGGFDLIEDFAAALPVWIIGDMLGVPRADRGPLRGWSLAILGALEPVLNEEQEARGNRAVAEFSAYLDGLIEERRRQGPDEDDVLSALIFGEVDGERLTRDELIQNCIFLLNAGHETTTNLIGNGVAALLERPEERKRFQEHPELVDSAVEEFLRFESSNQLGNRRATEDVTVGGVEMPEGTYIHIGIGAANRDPAQFPHPDRLDIGREPNRHLAFGGGIHTCAGNSLARMEGRIAISRLFARFPGLKPGGEAVRGGRARFRGFLSYPVAFG